MPVVHTDTILEFVQLRPALKQALLTLEASALTERFQLPMTHQWQADFGSFQSRDALLLNALVLFHVQEREQVHAPSGSLRHCSFHIPSSLLVVLSELFPTNALFWDTFNARRKRNTIWMQRVQSGQAFSEKELVYWMDLIYPFWFLFVDSLTHLSSASGSNRVESLTASSKYLLAATYLQEIKRQAEASPFGSLDTVAPLIQDASLAQRCLKKGLYEASSLNCSAFLQLFLNRLD